MRGEPRGKEIIMWRRGKFQERVREGERRSTRRVGERERERWNERMRKYEFARRQ